MNGRSELRLAGSFEKKKKKKSNCSTEHTTNTIYCTHTQTNPKIYSFNRKQWELINGKNVKWSEKWHYTTAMVKSLLFFSPLKQRRVIERNIDTKRKQEIFLLLPFLESLRCALLCVCHSLSICCRPKNYLNDTDVHWFSPIYNIFSCFQFFFLFFFFLFTSFCFISFEKWQHFLAIQPDVLGNWVFGFWREYK